MRYCGYSELFHDSGIAFIDEQGNIEFATHAERYKKEKHYPYLTDEMWNMIKPDDHTTYYEDHTIRMDRVKNSKIIDSFYNVGSKHQQVMLQALDYDAFITHHQSHAATAYYTRPWESTKDTAIVSVDGVGEWQTMVIFDSDLNELKSWDFPHSLGMWYTEVTKIAGLRTLSDDYVVMGMASYGENRFGDELYDEFMARIADGDQPREYVHHDKRKSYQKGRRGLKSYIQSFHPQRTDGNICHLAASMQHMAERILMDLAKEVAAMGYKKICWSGGCAENIVAMTQIKRSGLFEDMHIAIAPSDAGSALGAAAYSYCKANNVSRVNWIDPFLGYNMGCTINPKEVVDHLLDKEYCGIASGKAEFGPRALGNRSLIADPRKDVKDTVNKIKRRQEYRPFAPAILEEFADEYFEGPMGYYMQMVANAKHDYKSVTHVDGTGRVQLVPKNSRSIFRQIIEEFYERTGVPMLLNTSLNIRGMPMVNDHKDAHAFERKYGVKVFT